jgi:hypothetical protein
VLEPGSGPSGQQRPGRDQPGDERRRQGAVRVAAGEQRLGLVGGRSRGVEVDPAAVGQPEPVHARRAHQEPWSVESGCGQGGPDPAAQRLKRSRPGTRRRVLPQLVDELVVPHRASVLGGQEGEQVAAQGTGEQVLGQEPAVRLEAHLAGQVNAHRRRDAIATDSQPRGLRVGPP